MTNDHKGSSDRRSQGDSAPDDENGARRPAGRDTSEIFLDREALRYAAMRAGLEPGATPKVLDDWVAMEDQKPPRKGTVQFVLRSNGDIAEGRFDGRHFHVADSGVKVTVSDVARWRCVW